MTQENDKHRQAPAGGAKQQKPLDQGGHQGTGGHGGQQSGDMGGQHGGDLHAAGSGQSGMSGRGGMGAHASDDPDDPDASDAQASQHGGAQAQRDDSRMGSGQSGEIQHSAQREGMGQHRHSSRGNDNALDAAADVDDVGSQQPSAGQAGADKPS